MFFEDVVSEGLGVVEFYVSEDGGGEIVNDFGEGVLRDF